MSNKADYMGPIKNILLAADGSEYSESAAREAVYLAKACESKLSLIYVLEINPEFETEGLKFVEKMEIEAREYIEKIRKDASKENVEFEVIVRRSDNAYKAIVEEAEKGKSDVIIMGTRGRTGLKKLIMGSVTAKVIGHAPCNILVVPKGAKNDCRNILTATDGSRYGSAAAAMAIEIAKRCNSNLTIISVFPSEDVVHVEHARLQLRAAAEDEFKKMETHVRDIKDKAVKEGVKAEGYLLSGSAAETIIETANEYKADIVILGSHGRTGLDRLVMGSVTERVIVLSSCAVLVVKTK